MISNLAQISVQFRPYCRLICTKPHADMMHLENALYAFQIITIKKIFLRIVCLYVNYHYLCSRLGQPDGGRVDFTGKNVM